MRPAVRETGFKYWEYILCYVDDVLAISDHPDKVLGSVQTKFKLKEDKMEPPEVYLGAGMTQMDNDDGDLCWAMSSDKYCTSWGISSVIRR